MRTNMLKNRNLAENHGENRKGKYFQNMTKLKNNNSKGITLIALVITVIVLLILAGVSISAITGNESAMEKAKQAKTANENADILDSMKLAVVSAVANGTDGRLNGNNLAEALKGNFFDEINDIEQLNSIRNNEGPWCVKYDNEIFIIDKQGNVEVTSDKIGSKVVYNTELNGVKLNDWKIFYKDENIVRLILSDCLPTSAVNIEGLQKSGNYGIYNSNWDGTLILNEMLKKSNWTNLLKGRLNGQNIDYTSEEGTETYAIGTPTLEIFTQSWNTVYPENPIYIYETEDIRMEGYHGYTASTENNPPNSNEAQTSVFNGENIADDLYHPYYARKYNPEGYWIANPMNYGDKNCVLWLAWAGKLTTGRVIYSKGIRPVVTLPIEAL